MPPPDPPRERLFRAVALSCLVGAAAAVVGLLLLPRADTPRDAAPAEPAPRPATRPSAARPHRVSPFTDLASRDPARREHALRPRPHIDAWLADPNVSPPERTATAVLLRQALADEVPAVRLAAAELVAGMKSFAEVPPAEAVPAAEKLMDHPDAAVKVRAAAAVWGANASPAAAKVLLAVLADRTAPADARKRAARPNADGTVAALERILADPADDPVMRWHALDKLKAAPLTDALKGAYAAVAANTTDRAILRDYSFRRLTADLNPGAVPDALRPAVLAFTAADSPPLARIRAFALLDPRSERFGKDHPEVAKAFQATATDATADAAFRAFAALFFTPTTADQWAAAVRVLGEGEPESVGVRRALAGRLAEVFAGNPIPNEWVTPNVAVAMAICPSAVPPRTGRAEFTPAGEVAGKDDPKQTAEKSRRLTVIFRDVLVAAGPGVVFAVADGLSSPATRTRNLQVLARFGAEAKAAAPAVLWLLPTVREGEEREAADKLLAAWGPEVLAGRLGAKGVPAAERAAVLAALAKLDPKRAELFGWTPPKK